MKEYVNLSIYGTYLKVNRIEYEFDHFVTGEALEMLKNNNFVEHVKRNGVDLEDILTEYNIVSKQFIQKTLYGKEKREYFVVLHPRKREVLSEDELTNKLDDVASKIKKYFDNFYDYLNSYQDKNEDLLLKEKELEKKLKKPGIDVKVTIY